MTAITEPATFSLSPGKPLALTVALCAFYILAVFLALTYLVSASGLTAIRPSAGIFLAILLLTPRTRWPALILALGILDFLLRASLAEFSMAHSAILSLCLVLQALLAAALIQGYAPNGLVFLRVEDGLQFLLRGILIPVSLCSVPLAVIGELNTQGSWLSTLLLAAVSSGLSIVVLTPLLLEWTRATPAIRVQESATPWLEVGLACAGLAVLTGFVFTLETPEGSGLAPMSYLPILALILIAIRYNGRVVTLAALVFATVAIYTDTSLHQTLDKISFQSIHALQAFLILACATALLALCMVAERKEDARQLQESRDRYQLAISGANDGIWEMNFATGELYLSPRWKSMLGYAEDDLNGGIPEMQGLVHPDDAERVLQTLPTPDANFELKFTLEFRMQHKDGHWVDVRATGAGELDRNGKPVRFAGTNSDITQRNELERAIRQAQKMESVGQLTGGIAHDFNNLLSVISGSLELMRMRGVQLTPADQKLVDTALSATTRGAALTRRLLSFSSKKSELTVCIDANARIESLLHLLAKSLTSSIRLDTSLADDLYPIETDPDQLDNMLLNLALNARDAMPDGGSLFIETQNKYIDENYALKNPGSHSGDFAMIAISDTGTGMSEEIISHIFEPFFTTKGPGLGTGLGMSMVYGFIQRSGGHCKIYSEPGKGTTIRVFLPKAADPSVSERILPAITAPPPTGNETILVVDDEEALAELAASYLSDLGYQTLTASSGGQALTLLAANADIHLLFTDIIMTPEMDGFELAYRAQKAHPALRILLTSGFTGRREQWLNGKGELLERLTKSLLSKPYNLHELAFAVRAALDQ